MPDKEFNFDMEPIPFEPEPAAPIEQPEADFSKDEFAAFHDPIEEDVEVEDEAEDTKLINKAKNTEKIGSNSPENDSLWARIKNTFRKIAETIKGVFRDLSEPGLLYARLAGGKELANKIYDANVAEQARQNALEREKANNINKGLRDEIDALKAQIEQHNEEASSIEDSVKENADKDGTEKDNEEAKNVLEKSKNDIQKHLTVIEGIRRWAQEKGEISSEEDKTKLFVMVQEARKHNDDINKINEYTKAMLGKLSFKTNDEIQKAAEDVDTITKKALNETAEINASHLAVSIKDLKEQLKPIVEEMSEIQQNINSLTQDEIVNAKNRISELVSAAREAEQKVVSESKDAKLPASAIDILETVRPELVEIDNINKYINAIEPVQDAADKQAPEKEEKPEKNLREKVNDMQKEEADVEATIIEELQTTNFDDITEEDIAGIKTNEDFFNIEDDR